MLNEKQEAAANYSYKLPAVVTAAAGSGKTTLLVERVIRLIADINSGIASDTLAIMTFTRNATRSLREKLNRELNNRLAEETDPVLCAYLKDQIFRLRQAYISTIDAFCLRIIRENPEAFDLPMNFTLADTAGQTSMQLRAINLAMQALYKDASSEGSDFTKEERELLFFSFDFENDRGLQEAVMSVADKLSSYADAKDFLSETENAYSSIEALGKHYLSALLPGIRTDFLNAQRIIKMYDGLINDLIKEADELIKNAPDNETVKTYCDVILPTIKAYINFDIERYTEFCRNFKALEAAPSIEALCKLISDFRAHTDTSEYNGRTGKRTTVRSRFNGILKLSKKYANNILKNDLDYDGIVSSLPRQQKAVSAFIKLVDLYRGYYDSIKRASGCLDFADCELLLLNKLSDDNDFCAMISNRFSCIIVDEFQDSNDIQAEIFKLLGNGHLFYVGDIKQSIYAFRGGNPEIMARLCDGEDNFTPLPLNCNYRSREAVINVVNAAFTGLMTREYGGVDYSAPENQLVFGADKLPKIAEEHREKYNCEICFIGSSEDDEKDMTAPRAVAQKIRALHDDPDFKITKDGQLVRPEYSDFAILMRNKTRIPNYRAALSEIGISSAAPKGQNFLESEEITLIINYLTVVDNPLRDEELLKILMSPIYRFDAEEAGQLRLGLLGLSEDVLTDAQRKLLARKMKSYSLFNCVRICSKPLEYDDFPELFSEEVSDKSISRTVNKKLAAFVNDLNSFRFYMGSSSVYRLVCKICDDTDLAAVSAVLDDSSRRVANVRRFQDIAADFEGRDGGGLSDFLRFIERVRSVKNGGVEDASRPADNSSAVQIMTFHASKGLEVPVCIMAELDKPLSRNDLEGVTLINRDYGLAMMDINVRSRVKSKSFAHRALSVINRVRLIGEELRLLYVAMTRAQEKLIMMASGSIDNWNELTLNVDNEDMVGSREEIFEGSIPFRWIFSSLMRYYDAESKNFKGIECTVTEIAKTSSDNDIAVIESGADQYNITEDEAEKLSERIRFKYKYDDDTRRREKFSVTELAHRNSTMPVVLTQPRFAMDPDNAEISGTDKGNAYHNCMQYLPLEELKSAQPPEYEEIISRAVGKMKEQHRLTNMEAELVDAKLVAEFFGGELGQRVLRSGDVRREQPFYAEVNGEDIGEDDLKEITLQGRIDLYFIENGGIVVVDYKSDNVFNLEKEKKNYAKQVKIYSTILPMLTGLPVKGIYLYAFLAGEAIEIK